MHSVNNPPAPGVTVIGYDSENRWGLTRYMQVRVGWKFKKEWRFVFATNKSMVFKDIIGWNAIPGRDMTIPSTKD